MENDNTPNHPLVPRKNITRFPAPYPPMAESPIYMYEAEMEDRINLLDYWRVIVKRRWVIGALVFGILAVTAIATWKATPIYRATMQLQIDPQQSNLLPFSDMAEMGGSYTQSLEYLQTQFKVLESRTLAERVIAVLDLENNPAFMPEKTEAKSKTVRWLQDLFSSDNDAWGAAGPDRKMDDLVREFHDNLSTGPVRNTRLVNVSFDSPDPKLAAQILNTLAEEYIALNFETKAKSINDAARFLEKQVADLQNSVETAEGELVRFGQQHDIYEIGDDDNVILQTLSDLNAALTEARAERIQKESAWKIVRQSTQGVFPSVLRNSSIESLEKKIADMKVEQAKLAASFRPGWPALDQITEQISQAETQLEIARKSALENVEAEYLTALQKESMLADALAAQKDHASDFNQNSIQYNILKREAETQKELYEGLLQRMNEAGISESLKSNNIHVIDPASIPVDPSKPDKMKNMALALAVGLLLGVGLAFFIERLDNSVKTPDDIERFVHLPFLGIIPSTYSLLPVSRRKLLGGLPGNSRTEELNRLNSVDMITYHNSKSVVSEAYRNLRTSILLSSGQKNPPRLLLVTSGHPKEGKTTTAVNLAVTLSQTGDRVVILDCDMRNPNIHRVVGVKNSEGMSQYLSGQSQLIPMIQKTEIPNLSVVPAGIIPPNPAELLSSIRMKDCLELLKKSFDYVIIDSPPVLSVTDARIVGARVDGVVLVVKGGETPKEAVLRTRQMLQEVHAHIIGTLLNSVNVRSADYNMSKYQYYGYGYGLGYGYGKKSEVKEEIQS